MKNLKKVLAMVLAFACTFTMFASAKVYEDVQPGTEFSEAITMLSDLGIIQGKTDGKYHPEETITRAEACALIARLLTGDPNVSNFGGAQNFTDVVKGSWQDSAIGYCVANGITVGVGNGKFEPNRAINDQEFLTMMVRALGYETPDVKQGYPFSYMTVANAIGLRHDTNMMANTDALRGEDAQIIYNAMFVDYAKGAKMINTTHGTSVEKYPTLAESVWGLNRAALGTWNKKDNEDVTLSNCKAHTWVIIGEAQDEENALLAYPIDDDTTDLYKAEEKKHEYKAYKFKYAGDADALRGYQVELWGAGKHGDPVWEKEGDKFVYSEDWNIKAIKTVAGQTKYDYNSSMADKKDDNGEIVLNDETTLKLESVADNAKHVQHSDEVAEVVTFVGDKLNTVAIKADKDVEKALNVRNGMQFKLMDWDTDGDIDWIVVDEARYYKVESASSKRVNVTSMDADSKLNSDKDSKTETWKIDETEKIGTNDAKKDVKIKYEVPEGLKEGDIVEVTYKVTYEGKAQLVTATVTTVDADNQKLEKVGTKDGLTLTFGNDEVKVAQNAKLGDVIVPANPEKYKDFNGEELGTEFALYKNRNGFIVYSDYATESSNYMMVLNTYGGKDTTGNRDLAVIDFVDANNKVHKDVKVSSSARVLDKDGKTLASHIDGHDAYTDRKFDESMVVGNVFKYWTDEDGVITKMQGAFGSSKSTASMETAADYTYDADADRLIDTTAGNKYVASLEDANIIFAVKKDYIQADNNGGVQTDNHGGVYGKSDLKVDSADVLATKQKDIPDIGKDPTAEQMLGNRLDTQESWLGKKDATNKFVVELNDNSEASAAILGVKNFNKFAAGQTKLALVTNVSEDKNGVIEAEVAFDGKVETVASVEKQKFEDIVKVYDGSEDNDIARADATIKTKNGNGVFDGGKLSELVNQGGQYAEITVDADGKLNKLVFMDGEVEQTAAGTNDNKLTGHYYTVSRNLVLEAKSDKKMKYHKNDNNTYGTDRAVQYYAGSDDKLQTVKRLPAESAGYTSDAKFYQIDGAPTRHDKNYEGTRLTVNAGFNRLRQSDIKVVERGDIGAYDFKENTNKNVYEVSDLAFNSDNDLVAVFSFKNDMDQNDKYTPPVVVTKYKVSEVKFAKTDATAPSAELVTVQGNPNQFVVYVGGVAEKARAASTPVSGLTKDNFEVKFGGATTTQPTVNAAAEIKGHAGYYVLTLNQDVNPKFSVTVTVKAGGNAANVVDGVQANDPAPEIGNGTEGGETTPVEGLKYTIVQVMDTAKTIVLKFVDDNGAPVAVKNVSVVGDNAAQVLNNGDSFTINGSASLSEKTLLVDGKKVTLPKLTDDQVKKVEASASAAYELMSKTDDKTLIDVATGISVTNIAVGAKVEVVDFEDGNTGLTAADLTVEGNKVTAKPSVVNTKKPGTIKFNLQADGTKTANKVEFTINKVADITADSAVFDPKAKTLTYTMNKDYTALKSELEQADWKTALKSAAAGNIITAGGMEVVGAPVVNVDGGKTTVTLNLNLLGETVHTGDTVTGTDVMDDVTLISGTAVKPAADVTIARATLATFNVAQGADKKTISITVDNAEAAAYLAKDTKVFTVKADTDPQMGGAVNFTGAVDKAEAKDNVITLTVSKDLNSDGKTHISVELAETAWYKAVALVKPGVEVK